LDETTGGVTTIFSKKVADYIASRPNYPAALFDTLADIGQLTINSTVADIGAGTGLLTQGLLDRGYHTIAVEPNEPMRAAADHLLGNNSKYRSVNGSAEATLLPSSSVDLITAAQAFHWFEIEKVLTECLRVLSPTGQVALIWNDRQYADTLHIALDELFAEFGGAKRQALVTHEEQRDLSKFFGTSTPLELSWLHEHSLSEPGLASLVFSRSYMPDRETALGDAVRQRVADIFSNNCVNEKVVVRYTTLAIIGRPADLVDVFGSRDRVLEVIDGKRSIDLTQAEKLSNRFNLPSKLFLA
jgi:SAM-dependent methyltransferase